MALDGKMHVYSIGPRFFFKKGSKRCLFGIDWTIRRKIKKGFYRQIPKSGSMINF
jgi:hypothetical protein